MAGEGEEKEDKEPSRGFQLYLGTGGGAMVVLLIEIESEGPGLGCRWEADANMLSLKNLMALYQKEVAIQKEGLGETSFPPLSPPALSPKKTSSYRWLLETGWDHSWRFYRGEDQSQNLEEH